MLPHSTECNWRFSTDYKKARERKNGWGQDEVLVSVSSQCGRRASHSHAKPHPRNSFLLIFFLSLPLFFWQNSRSSIKMSYASEKYEISTVYAGEDCVCYLIQRKCCGVGIGIATIFFLVHIQKARGHFVKYASKLSWRELNEEMYAALIYVCKVNKIKLERLISLALHKGNS